MQLHSDWVLQRRGKELRGKINVNSSSLRYLTSERGARKYDNHPPIHFPVHAYSTDHTTCEIWRWARIIRKRLGGFSGLREEKHGKDFFFLWGWDFIFCWAKPEGWPGVLLHIERRADGIFSWKWITQRINMCTGRSRFWAWKYIKGGLWMSGIANSMRNPGFRLSIHPGEYKKEGTSRRDISSKGWDWRYSSWNNLGTCTYRRKEKKSCEGQGYSVRCTYARLWFVSHLITHGMVGDNSPLFVWIEWEPH